MKKLFGLFFSFILAIPAFAVEPDSLYFYRSGDIIYKNSLMYIDSVTFLPPDYYEKTRSDIVFNTLLSTADISTFTQMIQIAGYAKKLDNTTIWAPVNSALTNIDLSDTATVQKIVENQLARTVISTSFPGDSIQVSMLNTKKLIFKKTSFAGINIQTSNIYTARSIIHVMSGFSPYPMNIWEYITQGAGHDSMKAYVNSHTKTTLNPQTGTYTTTNDLLEAIGFTNDENSAGSAIIPNDDAWIETYNRLYPYCKAPTDGVKDTQDEATKFAIIHNNFFKTNINITLTNATYRATSGYVLKSPAAVLGDAQPVKLSNGTCYNVNELKMYNPENWNKEIRIEAEQNDYGVVTSNYSRSVSSYTGYAFNVSNNNFLTLTNTSSSSLARLFASFPIPNTLSDTYNVYCVFVPGSIVDAGDQRPYKVRFYLTYTDDKNLTGTPTPQGYQVMNATVDANNNVQSPSQASSVFVTDGNTVQKMLVAKNLRLPFCNFYMGDPSGIKFSLKVENAAGTNITETSNFNRNIRIDCIILEPVQ